VRGHRLDNIDHYHDTHSLRQRNHRTSIPIVARPAQLLSARKDPLAGRLCRTVHADRSQRDHNSQYVWKIAFDLCHATRQDFRYQQGWFYQLVKKTLVAVFLRIEYRSHTFQGVQFL
jgi:hypothetical protein